MYFNFHFQGYKIFKKVKSSERVILCWAIQMVHPARSKVWYLQLFYSTSIAPFMVAAWPFCPLFWGQKHKIIQDGSSLESLKCCQLKLCPQPLILVLHGLSLYTETLQRRKTWYKLSYSVSMLKDFLNPTGCSPKKLSLASWLVLLWSGACSTWLPEVLSNWGYLLSQKPYVCPAEIIHLVQPLSICSSFSLF